MREVLMFLNYEKFDLLLDSMRNNKVTTTMNMPFLEVPYELEELRITGDMMEFIQNKIRYRILKRHAKTALEHMRGYKVNMIYIDKDLTTTDSMLDRLIYPMLGYCRNTNQFTNTDNFDLNEFVKFI